MKVKGDISTGICALVCSLLKHYHPKDIKKMTRQEVLDTFKSLYPDLPLQCKTSELTNYTSHTGITF